MKRPSDFPAEENLKEQKLDVENPFDKLPHELIVKIMNFLGKPHSSPLAFFADTSKGFNAIAHKYFFGSFVQTRNFYFELAIVQKYDFYLTNESLKKLLSIIKHPQFFPDIPLLVTDDEEKQLDLSDYDLSSPLLTIYSMLDETRIDPAEALILCDKIINKECYDTKNWSDILQDCFNKLMDCYEKGADGLLQLILNTKSIDINKKDSNGSNGVTPLMRLILSLQSYTPNSFEVLFSEEKSMHFEFISRIKILLKNGSDISITYEGEKLSDKKGLSIKNLMPNFHDFRKPETLSGADWLQEEKNKCTENTPELTMNEDLSSINLNI